MPRLKLGFDFSVMGKFEGYGLQPVLKPSKINWAFAPEGKLIQTILLPIFLLLIPPPRGCDIFRSGRNCLNVAPLSSIASTVAA
jgi:hypothetical protein